MKGPGALAVMVFCALALPPALASPTPRRAAHPNASYEVTSPDRRKVVLVTGQGRVKVDGKLVRSGPGKPLCRPVWRRDSRALAFLQHSRHGTQLVVLHDLDPRHPLIWQLPSTADRLRKVFWISRRQLGVGANELMPRLVVSWSTPVASLPLW